jgi:hypothetical protein
MFTVILCKRKELVKDDYQHQPLSYRGIFFSLNKALTKLAEVTNLVIFLSRCTAMPEHVNNTMRPKS